MIDIRRAPFLLSDVQAAWVESTRAGLSAEEKAGQLFCVMGGDYAPGKLKEMVAAGKIGGVLFRPVKPGREIQADFAPLDAAARVPLLKAANLEEGGAGGMSDGTLFGWPMLTAATDDLQMAEKFGRVCGAEGASIGINWTFSPVCDLDLNYLNPITNVRTFGSDPKRVQAMTERYVRAVQDCGVAACAKHFPGDGVDYRDQHL
ncbi:MAG: glycoside hydrolase family 3 N-terminal domain-containing protein, partial [Candidatus Avoscillospira sp.]